MRWCLAIFMCLYVVLSSCKIKEISMQEILTSDALKQFGACANQASVDKKLDTYRICDSDNNASALFHPGTLTSGSKVSITTEDKAAWLVGADDSSIEYKAEQDDDSKSVTYTINNLGPTIAVKISDSKQEAKDFFVSVPVSTTLDNNAEGIAIGVKCQTPNASMSVILRPVMVEPTKNTVNTFAECLGQFQVLQIEPPLESDEDVIVL